MSDLFNERERGAWGGFLTAYARMNRLIEADLQAQARITHAEFEVLLRLALTQSRRLRIQDLASQSILTRSGTSRVVERLVRAGLVTREGAREDRRGAYAVLTPAGAERFRASAQAHVAFVRANFLDLFSVQEQKRMAAFWKRLAEFHADAP
jgi:DNA-binding MarR family transcriptional regulator